MNPREIGFLLLGSHLGDPGRPVLTAPQLRELARRVRSSPMQTDNRELSPADLLALGYGRDKAEQITLLLSQEELLKHYLQKGAAANCTPVSRVSPLYPMSVHNRLRDDSPGCIWMKGDASLLSLPAIALVGSRDIREENQRFAYEVGRQAALQGYVLISGNARGADKAAQQGCLDNGGQVISVVADRLDKIDSQPNMLCISEDGFDLPFSTQRALSRNRLIHCMGLRTFVAQAALGHGGTWDGSQQNLKCRWSPVYCFEDGSKAMEALQDYGAVSISLDELHHISQLPVPYFGQIDQW